MDACGRAAIPTREREAAAADMALLMLDAQLAVQQSFDPCFTPDFTKLEAAEATYGSARERRDRLEAARKRARSDAAHPADLPAVPAEIAAAKPKRKYRRKLQAIATEKDGRPPVLPQPRPAVAKPQLEKVESAGAAAATAPAQPLVAAVAEEQESSSAGHDKSDNEAPPKPYRPLPQTPTSKEREVAVKALKDPCLKTCVARTARPSYGQRACVAASGRRFCSPWCARFASTRSRSAATCASKAYRVCALARGLMRARAHSHLFTHTGAKPHSCQACSRSFRQKGTLTRSAQLRAPHRASVTRSAFLQTLPPLQSQGWPPQVWRAPGLHPSALSLE